MILAALGLVFLSCTMARPAAALSDQQEIVDKARITFDKLITSPEFAELPGYVKQAKAVIVFPALIKGGFIIGAEGGSGVLMVRDDKLGWSYPAFYTLAAGSLGLQIGGEVSEVVLTIMSEKALDAVIDNQMKFGGDVSLEGAGVLKRDSWNTAYYGSGATPYAILIQRRYSNPNAQPLRDALAPY
jgi:lipid-binding SYLF domain-containing protein